VTWLAIFVHCASALSLPSQSILPDHRTWEMVSAPEKHAGFIRPLIIEDAVQASSEGSAFTFLSEQSLLPESQGASVFDQVLARRTTDGWSDEDISTPHNEPPGQGVGQGQEYRLFSPDLGQALVQPFGSFTPLSPEATERTPYLRDDTTGGYLPLVTSGNVPPGTKFGGSPERTFGAVGVAGASPDLSHVVLRTEGVALTETPVEDGLYAWSAGRLQLVSVLPANEGGEPTERSLNLGDRESEVSHAISDDGSRIFWEGENSEGEVNLYVRDAVSEQSFRLDTVQSGKGEGLARPSFQAASADGSKVFFTDEQQLTKHSGTEGRDLYECEVIETAGALSCALTDLTPSTGGESAEVISGINRIGVLGASEDGSYLYFVAHGVLAANENEATGETATIGANNLYVLHNDGTEWTTSFIAMMSSEEVERNIQRTLTPRVSPSGRYFAFMSENSLTGYDNDDANSDRPDEEVFLYDDEATPHLICASCDPTGARPVGQLESEQETALHLVDSPRTWDESWLAADVPTQEDFGLEDARYQPRYLSDDGRLYFNSIDALVPQAVNGQWDVYQYEPAGIGTCTTASETFEEKTGGCVNLMSPGTSSRESAFLGASETGGDVFFLTAERLVPQDTDEQLDVYDAHECSVSSPCVVPPAATSPSPCTTSEDCRPDPFAEPSVPGLPGSAMLAGDGNVSSTVAKAKPLTRAQKLTSALKACLLDAKHKRSRCRAAAIKRYGVRATAKKPKSSESRGR
jgi:hypothetical protein